MTTDFFSESDAQAGRVRQALEALREQVSTHHDPALSASLSELERRLDLPAPRATRRCPRCQAVSMIDATRCGTCWDRLTPMR